MEPLVEKAAAGIDKQMLWEYGWYWVLSYSCMVAIIVQLIRWVMRLLHLVEPSDHTSVDTVSSYCQCLWLGRRHLEEAQSLTMHVT